MDETSVISAITVTNVYGNVSGTVTYANKIATFNPNEDFYEIMDYTVTVSMAARDTADNALAADYTWTFTTGYLVNAVAPTPGDGNSTISVHSYARSVSLTWILALDDVTRQGRLQYRVLQSDSADTMDSPSEIAANIGSTVEIVEDYTFNIGTYTVTGLAPETTYYFNIMVKDAAGNEAVYTTVQATTDAVPGDVTMTMATAVENSITLNWTGLGAGNRVEILWDSYGSTTAADATAFTATVGLAANTEYYFTLIVHDADDNVSPGIRFYITTSADATVENYDFIYTPAELYDARNNLSYNYILMANIDLSSYAGGSGWAPIGGDTSMGTDAWEGTPYSGSFDGNGNTISNLKISRPAEYFVGLFGFVSSTGSVKRLTLSTTGVSGNGYVGAVAGLFQGTAAQCQVTASAAVTGASSYTGGFAGLINVNGTMTTCSFIGSVTGNVYTGGFAGSSEGSGTRTNCAAAGGTVSGQSSTGGFAGRNLSPLTNCMANQAVTGAGNNTGGFLGANVNASLTNCYAQGNVTSTGGYSYCGGLIGSSNNGASYSISSCYASGNVTGTGSYFGGLIGSNTGGLTGAYATGSVTVTGTPLSYTGGLIGYHVSGSLWGCHTSGNVTSSAQYIGGLVGYVETGTLTYCYYEIGTVSGTSGSWVTAGLVGWNFGALENCRSTGSVVSVTNAAGGLVGVNDPPATINLCYVEGNISSSATYTAGLVVSNNATVSHSYFSGTVQGADYVGGLVALNGGTIQLSYSTGIVTGNNSVGGLIASNNETVSRCYSTSNVTADSNAGGLIGANSTGTSVTDSYARGAVSPVTVGTGINFGGLVGCNWDEVALTNCYATGLVTAASNAGGLVGLNDGASMVTVTSCYYDSQTTGQSDTGKGEPKTTAEMLLQGTYTGWDFTVVTGVWLINSGVNNGYPALSGL